MKHTFIKGENHAKAMGFVSVIAALVILSSVSAYSQGTAFTYQGKLTDAGAAGKNSPK